MKIDGLTRFTHAHSDGIRQEQPDHTISDGLGWTVVKSAESKGYYTSIRGLKKYIGMPSGMKIRGRIYLPEFDFWIIMGLVGSVGQVGIADQKTKNYTTIVTDGQLDRPLGLKECKWTKMVVNIHANCNRLKIYFTTNKVYRVIELFDPCRDFSNTLLFKPTCIGVLSVTAQRGLGTLVNGVYGATLKIYDKDGNDTNFNLPSQPVTVSYGDNRIDEVSTYGLVIEGFNLPRDYNLGELVITENIDGAWRFKVINDVAFGDGYFNYVYTGAEGYYADGKLADINTKKQQYFRGDGIDSHDNTLIIDDVEPVRNFNLQKYVNKFGVGYKRWIVPAREAKFYKGLRENENYAFCIWFNGKDGTKTISYPLINPNRSSGSTVSPGEAGNCTNCPVQNWATVDTSVRTKLYTIFDLCQIGGLEGQSFSNELNKKNNLVGDITPKVSITGNPLSKCCNGSCSSGGCNGPGGCMSGSSCSGGSCAGGFAGSDGILPRTNRKYDLSLNEETEQEEETVIDNSYSELCEMFNCDKILFQSSLREIIIGLYKIANAIREGFGLDPIAEPQPIQGCTCQVYEEYKSWTEQKKNVIKDKLLPKAKFKEVQKIPTKYPCTTPGELICVEQICYECVGGYWNYVNNAIVYKDRLVKFSKSGQPQSIKISKTPLNNMTGPGGAYALTGGVLSGDPDPDLNPWGENCINDLTPPIPYSEGLFGYWETNERYPTTVGRDDCQPIFREFAGKNEILCKVPSLGKEPHFFSFSSGVPSKQDMGNDELSDTYAVFTGLRVWDIIIPEEIKDWVCQKNPFTIGYAKRTESNKTVISTGILHGTHGGTIQGETFLFPKIGVNSFEFYDANINPGGRNTFRRGFSVSTPAYIYHSPDYHLYGNQTEGHYSLFQMEMFGKGYRHGLYADGKKPDRWDQPRLNQTGARQGLSINKYICKNQPIVRCIKGMTNADANKIIGKDSGYNFTYSLVNLMRESSQYIEYEGSKVGFTKGPDGAYGSLNGGSGDANESDNSFIGDTINHETFVKNNRAHLVTTMRYLPNQYGSIISRPYIPIGLNGTNANWNEAKAPGSKTSIEGIVGDSFIGAFTYKRTSHVSDKVPEEISPGLPWGLVFEKDDSPDSMLDVILQVFKEFVANLLEAIGFEAIGTTPTSGDRFDPRNLTGGLRNGWLGMTSENTPIGAPSGGQYPDTYFPQMASHYVFTMLPSDANLNYRGTGSVIFGEDGVAEVHRHRLKTLNLDSTMPDGWEIFRAWLNRTYGSLLEPSRWKMIIRILANIVWSIGIGLWIIFEGISLISFDTSGVLGLIGAVLSVVAAIFIIAIGATWISFWIRKKEDNQVIDFMISIEWAYPDKELRKENEPGTGARHAMFHSRIKGFEDNYWYYNSTYSAVNEISPNFGMPFYYDTEYCPDKYTNRLIASLRQDSSSEIDAYRQFKPIHYVDVPRNRGKIMDIITMGQQMYVQTTDTIFNVGYQGDSLRQLNSEELLLGKFYLFGKSVDMYGGVVEGAAGTKDPNASITTIYGHMYIDRDGHRFRVFTGNDSSIPTLGIEEFMDDNIKFHLLDVIPDYPYVDEKCSLSVYFEIGLDHGNNMIYLMKKDFLPKKDVTWNSKKDRFECGGKVVFPGNSKYFQDKSFLWTYNMRSQKWVCRQFLRPQLFLQDRYALFPVQEGGDIWTNDTKGIFNNFFGVQYPYYIEIPVVDERLHNTSTLRNIKIVGEIIDHFEDGTWQESDEKLIDAFMIYNGRQNSGWLHLQDLAIDQKENLMADIEETDDVRWKQKGNGLVIEEFRAGTSLVQKPLDTQNIELDILDIKSTRGISYNDKDGHGATLEDDYFVIRLFFNKKSNQEIHLRKLIVSIGPEQDG